MIINRLKYYEESNINKNYKLLETPEFVSLNNFIYIYLDVFQTVTLDKGFKRLARRICFIFKLQEFLEDSFVLYFTFYYNTVKTRLYLMIDLENRLT